ncbi:forespore capture DNA-binding protein RefZ [Cytobacillus sp. S13-E01]|uniref:forespore capture DNA-binding protein RefZ n=1 Tax=Cytobacillus sp. S13-E01 TaxID=3031326 RepID=UPI0023D7BC67|nr:forespore capture DNA-binding protein RefZ [Cytobacillus sp. S13-E01]MDF0726440.1 forespore capture DNA-binding protein RefZ [Cytobacillus sp. S13-E01]
MKTETKQKVIDAAIYYFNTKGFDGTSVREIAKKANVNVANISYYFENKGGLLEHLLATYFEGYLSVLENRYNNMDLKSATECLLLVVKDTLMYQKENRHLARFVHRELTLDTLLIREIMTTYLAKEKYYLKSILEAGIRQKEFKKIAIPLTIIQLKGMLIMPFMHPQYMSEVLHIMPYEAYFTEQYGKEIERWINETICESYHSVQKTGRTIALPV